MFVAAFAVALKFGLIAGATFGFFVLPAGLLTTAMIFGRVRRDVPVYADADSQAVAPVPSTVATGTRPRLRVVSGHSRAQSA
jgi:membrane protein required for beta-lactamase induction